MTPNIPTLLMTADFENKHSDLLAAARAGKPHEPKTGCAPSPALMKGAEAFLEKWPLGGGLSCITGFGV